MPYFQRTALSPTTLTTVTLFLGDSGVDGIGRWLIYHDMKGERAYAKSEDVNVTSRPHYAGLETKWSVNTEGTFLVDPAVVVTPQFW